MNPIVKINNIKEYKYVVGNIMYFCQCIELNIKSIYFGMNLDLTPEEYEEMGRWTLGQTLTKLQELDYNDGHGYFKQSGYELLFELKEIRNYYAHECFLDWVYDKDNKLDFYRACSRAVYDHNRLLQAHKVIEDIRKEFHHGKNK